MENLNLVNQIVRDVEAANSRRETNITWKNWNANDILEPYNVRSLKVKNIIRRAVKTDGASLCADIEALEKQAC